MLQIHVPRLGDNALYHAELSSARVLSTQLHCGHPQQPVLGQFRWKMRIRSPKLARNDTASTASASSSESPVGSYGVTALALLNLGEALNIPYLRGAAGLAKLIVETVQSVNVNQKECRRMSDQIVQLVVTIYNKNKEVNPATSPELLDDLENLCNTLTKFHSCLKRLAARGKFFRYVNSTEDADVLQDCQRELDQALNMFDLKSKIVIQNTVAQMNETSHGQFNDAMATMRLYPDEIKHTIRTSMMSAREQSLTSPRPKLDSINSSLRGRPKIFHGREKELDSILGLVIKAEPARIAIRGPGGIGKSDLACAVLHCREVVRIYGPRRHFIPCDSARSKESLISTLAAYFGLINDRDMGMQQLADQVLMTLSMREERSIIVLDNFESPWEPLEGRVEVEDFLSILSGFERLTLIITLRGAERPQGTKWTRPCLDTLRPLSYEATRKTFLDISDKPADQPLLNDLIKVTDGLPLAVTLMANLAEYEDIGTLLQRWKSERTSMLSSGRDPRRSLDISIELSVNSPRMLEDPAAGELLSLISILPDGLSRSSFQGISSQVEGAGRGATVLRQNSLVYDDESGRLRVLDPIRAFIRTRYPADSDHLHILLDISLDIVSEANCTEKARDASLFTNVAAEVGNIQAVLEYAFEFDPQASSPRLIEGALALSKFQRYTSLGSVCTLQKAVVASKRIGRRDLQAECLRMIGHIGDRGIDPHSFKSRVEVLEQAISLSEEVGNWSCMADCLGQLGLLASYQNRLSESSVYLGRSLSLYERSRNHAGQAEALLALARLAKRVGKQQGAIDYAQRSLSIYQSMDDLIHEAVCKQFLAEVAIKQSDYTKATRLSEEAIEMFETVGLDVEKYSYHAYAVACLGQVSLKRSSMSEAKTHYLTVLQIYHKLRRRDREADVLVNLSSVSLGVCDIAGAQEYLDRATEIWRMLRNAWGEGCCHRGNGDIAFRSGNMDKAGRLFGLALKKFQEAKHKDHEADCLTKLGDVALGRSNTASARNRYIVAFAQFRSVHQLNGQVICLKKLGDVFRKEGEVNQAEALYRMTLTSFNTMGVPRDEADCRLHLGDLASLRRQKSESTSFWRGAMELYRAAEDVDGAKKCLDRLNGNAITRPF